MNLSRRLLRLCESIDREDGRNRIFFREYDKSYLVDTTMADYERNTLIINTINDLMEGGNWNQLDVIPTDNVYITRYQTPNGVIREYRSNRKKFSDVFEFSSEVDAKEFFDKVSADMEDQTEEQAEETVDIDNAEDPEAVEIEADEVETVDV